MQTLGIKDLQINPSILIKAVFKGGFFGFSANALLEDRERFLDAGMDDYISKPYAEKDVLRVLRKYLA